MVRHRRLLGLAALLATTFLPAHADVAPGDPAALLDRADGKWRQGPARYLITRDEDAQFRKLKTDEERKAFVDQFWARRDPSPGTPANEFKDLLVKRLTVIEQRFGGHNGKGWEDDRGRTVLLLGPPDKIEVHESGSGDAGGQGPGGPASGGPADSGGSGPRRKATFIFERPVVPGAVVPLKIELAEETTGEYRLLSKFDFTDPRLTGVTPLPLPAPAPAAPPKPEPPPPAAPAPEPPAAPPTPQQALMEELFSGVTPTVKLPIFYRFDFFKTADAGTMGTLTLAIKKPTSGNLTPIVAARITGPEDKVVAKFDREDTFAPSPANSATGGEVVFQAAHDLPPGKYSFTVVAKDPNSGEAGFLLNRDLVVPDFHGTDLGISTVVLARKVERLAAPADATARYVLGNFKVLPSPRPSFKAGEDVWLYYQIYNTANDAASGQPKIKVSYTFQKIEKTKPIILGGKPIEQVVNNNVQAYSVTVAPQWPAGEYQVLLKVDDLIAAKSATAAIAFSVVK
ncbi:MAG: GWxTD domain-containing protein [Acidobacteria bacterium]|nr:GWxTD domain-containing protein [Acidobacteriota bacterium]